MRVPDGAIRVEPDLYMVPLPKPVAGCPAFRPFSRTRKVPQAIYWRGVDGGFVRDRNKARCDGPPKRH